MKKIVKVFIGIAVVVLGLSLHANADTHTWEGNGADNKWNTGLNWDLGYPVSGDALVFQGSAQIQNTNDLQEYTTFTSITFNSASNFAVDGTAITLGYAEGGSLINLSTGAPTFGTMIMTLGGPATITNNGGLFTISSNINGSGSLTKTGTGTLVLSGSNTFSGSTTVNGGSLSISKDANLGTAPGSATPGHLTLNGGTLSATVDMSLSANRGIDVGESNGTINVANGKTLSYGGILAGSGKLTKTGAGTLHVFGTSNTISGGLSLTDGYLRATSESISGDVEITGGTWWFEGNTSLTYAGKLTGTGGTFWKTGSGKLTLTGSNTYSGQTSVYSGTLECQADNQIRGSVDFDYDSVWNLGSYSTTTGSITLNGTAQLIGSGTIEGRAYDIYPATGALIDIKPKLSGTAALILNGAGVVTLYGTNTYSGGTTIWEGTLRSGGNDVLPNTGTITLCNESSVHPVLDLNGYNDTIESVVSANGTNAKILLGTGGVLTIGNNDKNNTAFYGEITGAGSVVKTGTGTMFFHGTQTYTGGTVVKGGELQCVGENLLAPTGNVIVSGGTFFNGYSCSVGAVTLSSGTIAGSGTAELTGSSYEVQSGTVSAILGGVGAMTKSQSGTVTLSGANTYQGITTISGGVLSISNDNNLGSAPGSATPGHLVLNGGELYVTESMTLSDKRGVSLGAGNGKISVGSEKTLSYGGVMAGSGTLTKSEAGTFTLTGVNTYTGSTTIAGGTLSISQDSNLGAAPASATPGHLVLNGGALYVSSAMTLSDKRGISLGTGNGEIIASGDVTYGGIIAGSGALTKSGGSTFTLTAANTYNGATTLAGGWLAVEGSIANSATTVNEGALGGSGTVGAVTLNSGGAISPGTFGSVGTLTSGNQTWNNGGWYYWDVNGTTSDLLNMQNLDISGLTTTFTIAVVDDPGSVPYEWTVATFTGLTGTFDQSKFDFYNYAGAPGNFSMRQVGSELRIAYDAVPEPSVAGLFMMSLPLLGGIGWRMRRKKN